VPHCAASRKVAVSISDGVIVIFSMTYSFRQHYGPGVDSTSNTNGYQGYSLGVKCGRCLGMTTLPHSCVNCLEIWEPQILEPSGPAKPVQVFLYTVLLGLKLRDHREDMAIDMRIILKWV